MMLLIRSTFFCVLEGEEGELTSGKTYQLTGHSVNQQFSRNKSKKWIGFAVSLWDNRLPVTVASNDWNNRLNSIKIMYKFSVFQWLNHVQLFETLWSITQQAPLSSTVSQSLLKFVSIESTIQLSHPLSSPSPAFNLS